MAKVTQLLEKQQEILFVDFTDSRYSEEEMVQFLVADGESEKQARQIVRISRTGISRKSTRLAIVDDEAIEYLVD
jgi:hypothetical protein